MINVFARTITDELTSLVKQINTAVAENQDARLSSFVVFLTDDPDTIEPKITKLAESAAIDATPLTMFEGVAGPSEYKIAEDADVTVMLWNESEVQTNFAFRAGELNAAKIEEIVAAAGKMVIQ